MKIVLFGQYKTGTTGLFYALRRPLKGSVMELFEKKQFRAADAEGFDHVIAKTILDVAADQAGYDYPSFADFDKTIVLTRDPRDWIVSSTLFLIQEIRPLYSSREKMTQLYRLLRRKEADPASLPLIEILDYVLAAGGVHTLQSVSHWTKNQLAWLVAFERSLSDHHLIRYEDFVRGRLSALEDYMGTPLNHRVDVPEHFDHTLRTGYYGDWRNWFVAEDIAHFREILSPYIEAYGYEPDWTASDQPRISPQHCSDYVRRVVAKKKGAMPIKPGTEAR